MDNDDSLHDSPAHPPTNRTGPRRSRLALATLALAATLAAVSACGSDDEGAPDKAFPTGGGKPTGPTVTVVLGAPTGASGADLERAREILDRRLELAGVPGTVELRDGRLVVTGAAADREVLTGIERRGRLEFRPVYAAEPVGAAAPAPPGATGSGELPGVSAELRATYAALDCSQPTAPPTTLPPADAPAAACAQDTTDGTVERFLLGPTALDGGTVQKATAEEPDEMPGQWQVTISFNSAGADKFGKLTTDLSSGSQPTDRLAVTLDGVVLIAPTVAQPLSGGTAVITGKFTRADARRIAASLQTGALPVPLTVESTT
ncbi:SecDF P1 head subdomain-containing protein [Streptodolium elevatio]|uniref:SecDF P1 head subdomain domain-containing protein n=1 Tax=Streptodolium elevatio TaxID=3157996 RepID=A0ABV3D970_9ACTN